MGETPYACPLCKADLHGEGIPNEHQAVFGAQYFSRVIALYSRDRDRTEAWKCPDCDGTWPR